MVTEGKARPSLMTRVRGANKRGADLFLSIHHDSVPGIYNESWEFEGKKRPFQRPVRRLFRVRLAAEPAATGRA